MYIHIYTYIYIYTYMCVYTIQGHPGLQHQLLHGHHVSRLRPGPDGAMIIKS